MIMSESHVLGALVRIVVDDAKAACRRVEDQALNQARDVVLEAQDRVDELTRAARELGRTRGHAAEAAEALAARAEIATVEAGAMDALFERFTRRVLMALKALPEASGGASADASGKEGRYRKALEAWAQVAAGHMDAPAEVFASKRDRSAIYAALLAAGAEDFHVRVDHRVHVGFVVRDLDGKTLHDARPEALVEAHATSLRALLERRVPPAPAGVAAGEGSAGAPREATETATTAGSPPDA